MTIKWGHFSDLHFKYKDFDTNQLRDSLLKTLSDNKIELDCIFITGDISHKNEYGEDVVRFIHSIAEKTKCEKHNIFVIPGNHDAKRSEFRKRNIDAIIDRIEKDNGKFELNEDEQTTLVDSCFRNFYELQNKITEKKRQNNTHGFENFKNINIILLNTAIFAGQTYPGQNASKEDADKENTCLFICENNLYKLKELKENDGHDEGALNIVLAHHGVECFKGDEQVRFANFLDSVDVDLFLCGHVHENMLTFIKNTTNNIPQVSCGGLFNEKHNEASFIIGEYDLVGNITLSNYSFISKNNTWAISPTAPKPYKNGIYKQSIKRLQLNSESQDTNSINDRKITNSDNNQNQIRSNNMEIIGYTLLGGRGIDGIKYHWRKNGSVIESLAFNKRLKAYELKPEDAKVSAYTTSISCGCILNSNSNQCKFCETGNLKFEGYLTAKEVALQNIFMAEYDSDCGSYPMVRDHSREFSFMGQGEPGYAYHIIREAIMLTDCAMSLIDQTVHRFIISSSGITGFIPLLINDIKNKAFNSKVTLHFSLHAIDEDRDYLMPINKEHNYCDFIKECKQLYECTGDKIGVGILILDKFEINNDGSKQYTLTKDKLKGILDRLDPAIFRIDLCDYNTTSLAKQSQVSNEYASQLLGIVKAKGFEGKLFSSFGSDNESGCGMLKSSTAHMENPGNKTKEHYVKALELLNEAVSILDRRR